MIVDDFMRRVHYGIHDIESRSPIQVDLTDAWIAVCYADRHSLMAQGTIQQGFTIDHLNGVGFSWRGITILASDAIKPGEIRFRQEISI